VPEASPLLELGSHGWTSERESQAEWSARRWFEELDWIAIGILELNLSTRWAGLHLVTELHLRFLEPLNLTIDVSHLQNNAIPSARLLALPIGHRPRARRAGAAQQQLEATEGHGSECRQLLVFQREAEVLRVKIDSAPYIRGLIANTV
jgi:hypothetical protein